MLPPELVQRVAVCIESGDDFVTFLDAMTNTRLTLPLLLLQTLAMSRSADEVWPAPNLEALPCPQLVPLSITIEGACSAARMTILPSLCAVIAHTPSLRTLDIVFARTSELYRPSITQLVAAIAASHIVSLSLLAHDFFKLPSDSAHVLGQYLFRSPMTHVRLSKISFDANGLLSWLVQHLLMSPTLVELAVLDSPVVASVVPPRSFGRHLQCISLSAVSLSETTRLTQRLADHTHLTSLSLHFDASAELQPTDPPNGHVVDNLICNVLPHLHRLVELSLRHCVVSPAAMHALGRNVLPRLNVLELAANSLYDRGCLTLACYLPTAHHLVKLALINRGCMDAGVPPLVIALERLPSLTTLDLSELAHTARRG
ncbi:hypothetical protein SDRG_09716 [Saprolegnia diclina VS20]|uniref:F-box domain-containing protein n=1 Tax=Saprolegnia diclina (strain VS20) TaxID=1156394 RepID=T0Q4I1_SAPDV|nr:hypothetical protein SDRG_09716 [Saprolegnia diclina VS20]EQC32744.1 hypothetical protein SDRG_09716 [Saprolegnia diclina VS20]|eukprot:XP_008613888.1 hypothetical protein SDRG_09716 [Saprolegnia diclina VS20]